jgi:hypothetical protein
LFLIGEGKMGEQKTTFMRDAFRKGFHALSCSG